MYLQLFNELKKDITNNYSVGQKLPSIRKIASTYNLSKTTVVNAFNQLYAEGYIESRAKSGYYVADILYKDFKAECPEVVKQKEVEYIYDFFPAQLTSSDFPIKIWKQIFNKVVNQSVNFGAYPKGQGELELREQIVNYLQRSRAVKADVNNIIITHGFADSMELLAKLLKSKFDTLAIESPGYHLASKAFSVFGYKIKDIEVEKSGLKLESFKKSGAKLLYITPSHQYPTGVVMPISKRQQLLEYISKISGLVIEDDYDSELAYKNRPIPSLQGLNSDVVIYLGTFAKSLSPAIRVGFMVVPEWIVQEFNKTYDAHFARVSLDTQLTLAKFIKDGHFERQVRRIRAKNRKKHNTMLEAVQKHLKNYKIVAKDAGLAILISPTKPFSYDKLKELALKERIKIYLTQDVSQSDFKAVRLGFGGFEIEEIEDAIIAFSKVWERSFL